MESTSLWSLFFLVGSFSLFLQLLSYPQRLRTTFPNSFTCPLEPQQNFSCSSSIFLQRHPRVSSCQEDTHHPLNNKNYGAGAAVVIVRSTSVGPQVSRRKGRLFIHLVERFHLATTVRCVAASLTVSFSSQHSAPVNVGLLLPRRAIGLGRY